jgi:methylglyoxal/glyoxal reductase
MSEKINSITASAPLNSGGKIPRLGLGTYLTPPGQSTEKSVLWALEAGYRHIDTAAFYKNEADVGRAIKNSKIPRDQIFVTTKVWNSDIRAGAINQALETSLKKLALDYVDLYLVHWPGGGATWAWPGMEAARERSYARAIGVSNFDVDELDQLIAGATVVPVVDQVQFNPSAYRKALLDACDERGVALEAYSPLGTGTQLGDPVVVTIADRLGRSPAQILLRWCVQRGIPVITKSTHRDRIAENAQIFDFELATRDIEELDALDRSGRTGAASERKWW